ncbi:MAG: hypothetical protein U0903_13190 [Planctomycetales bacterium]
MTTAIEVPKIDKPSAFASVIRGVTIAVVLLFCVFLSIAIYFGENSLWVQYQARIRRDAMRAEINLKTNAKIETEIQQSGDHPWAGDYYHGNGLSHVCLKLAPKAGCLYELYGCIGLYERLYGGVIPRGDRLELTFAGLAKPVGHIHREYIPVSWGARRYLIPPEELVKFCRDVNTGHEPRESIQGWYLLRRGDEKKPATGLPQLPKEFQPHLRTGPIVAEIEAVQETRSAAAIGNMILKRTAVSLKGGREQGLRGMELRVTSPEKFSGTVKVQYVFSQTSGGAWSCGMTGVSKRRRWVGSCQRVTWGGEEVIPWRCR